MTPSLPAGTRTNAAQIGVVMNMPLFAGFAVQNRIKETLALEDKARAQLNDARRVMEQRHTAFLGVQSGQAQVKALEATLASSQSALEPTAWAMTSACASISVRPFNAQSQVYQTERDLATARYQVLLGQLKLRQAAGVLTDDDLRMIDALTRVPDITPTAAKPVAAAAPKTQAKSIAKTAKR